MMTPMALDTRSAFALHDIQLTPVREQLLPVPVAPATTVADVKAEIVSSATELKKQRGELIAATRGTWETVEASWTQRARRFVQHHRLTAMDAVAPGGIIGAIAGAVVGFGASALLGDDWGWKIGLTIFGASLALGPVSAAVLMLGSAQEKRARGRMVERKQIAGPLERFRAAKDVEKAHIVGGLEKLERSLHSNKAVSPEALVELRAAIADGVDARMLHAPRVRQMTLLGGYLKGELDADAVRKIVATLGEMTPVDRAVAARSFNELIFVDRKRVAALPYEVRNDLYNALTSASAAPTVQAA